MSIFYSRNIILFFSIFCFSTSTLAEGLPNLLGKATLPKPPLKCAPPLTKNQISTALKTIKCTSGYNTSFFSMSIPANLGPASVELLKVLTSAGFKPGPIFHFGQNRLELKLQIAGFNSLVKIYPPAVLLDPVRISLTQTGPNKTSLMFELLASQMVHTPGYATGTQLDDKLITALSQIKGSIRYSPSSK